MAENPQQNVTDPNADPNAAPDNPGGGGNENQLWAGKYETPEQLEQGIREARKSLGLDPMENKPVVGQGGIVADHTAAEQYYKDMQALISKNGAQSGTGQQNNQQTDPNQQQGGQQLSVNKPGEGGDDDGNEPDVDQILQSAGLDGNELAQQFAQNGELTSEQYEALRKQGYPRPAVDSYMRAAQAEAAQYEHQQQQIRQDAAQLVGGEQALDTLLQQAPNFVPTDEIDDINERLGDPKKYRGAIRDLKEYHQQALGAGNAQPLISGQGAGNGGAGPIQNRQDFVETHKKAQQGDQTAQQRIANTPLEDFMKFQ